jgi:hypothetical protein
MRMRARTCWIHIIEGSSALGHCGSYRSPLTAFPPIIRVSRAWRTCIPMGFGFSSGVLSPAMSPTAHGAPLSLSAGGVDGVAARSPGVVAAPGEWCASMTKNKRVPLPADRSGFGERDYAEALSPLAGDTVACKMVSRFAPKNLSKKHGPLPFPVWHSAKSLRYHSANSRPT